MDLGTNLGMNTPEIYSVVVSGGTVTVTGEARAGATVQFFEAAIDPSGAGEGASFLYEGVVSGATPGAVDSTARRFSFTFAAGALAVGDQLTATAIDASGNTSEFSFNELAAPPNTPPVANDAFSIGNEDDPSITLTLTGSDLEGPIASFRIVGALPASGLLYTDAGRTMLAAAGTDYAAAGNALTLYFVPAANWSGVTGFQFTVTDAGGLTDSTPATASITVGAVNDAPVALGESYSVTEDFALSVPFGAGVLANDTDVDTAPLTAVLDAGPANGSITFNPNGSFTYIPNANFNGVDTFAYHAFDGSLSSATTTVTITVDPADDSPVATGDVYVAAEDAPLAIAAPGVLANDTGLGDGGLTLTVTTGPANGSVVLNADGSFTYTPTANFSGPDGFTYQVRDGDGDVSTATVSITVDPADDLPVANGDAYVTTEDAPLTIATPGVLANDAGLWDGGITLSVVSVSGGTVSLSNDGSFLFTPAANFSGLASFSYEVRDADGDTSTATVAVTVTPANDPPVANDDAGTVTEDSGANTINVLANDSILPDAGETLMVVVVTQGANGAVAIGGGGTAVTYTPNADFFGPDSFTYTISDGNGGTATATVNVTVTAANDTPVATNDAYAALEDTPLVFGAPGVLANDGGLGDGPLTLTVVGVPVGGGVALANDGSFTFTPTANFTGAASFQYQVQDVDGETATASVSITIASINDAPMLDLDANDSSGAAAADYRNTFTEGGLPVRIADFDATLADLDSPTSPRSRSPSPTCSTASMRC